MRFYLLLAVCSVFIAGLGWVLWRKTRSISFPFGAALLYYWTLSGAWVLVRDKSGYGEGQSYHYAYFEDRLFPVTLDSTYFETLVLYSVFVLVVLLTALMLVHRPPNTWRSPSLVVSHWRLIAIAVISAALSYLIVAPSLAEASHLDESGYSFTRTGMELNPLFTLHQLLNRFALLSLFVGLAVRFSGRTPRLMAGIGRGPVLAGYGAVSVAMLGFLFILGNRNELVFSATTAVLFYLANTPKPNIRGLIVALVLLLAVLSAITHLRDAGMKDTREAVRDYDASSVFTLIQTSNEQFAPHFSLYGVLRYNIPETYGSSFVYLGESVIPRILRQDRSEDIYTYYAKMVKAAPGQNYAIHHAAGWYLNFGLPGLLMGAVIMGWLWATCFNAFYKTDHQQHGFRCGISTLSAWTFVANIPMMIRNGPEGYKEFLLHAILLPATVVMLARVRLPSPSVSVSLQRLRLLAHARYAARSGAMFSAPSRTRRLQ